MTTRATTSRPDRAMVLAAGLGTRMRPLTETRPKALVRIGGRTLVDHALDRVAEAGIETAIVNVHHHADMLEAHLAGRRRPRIVVSDERDALLETGGGVKRALPLLGDGPFVVVNADTLWIEGAEPMLVRMGRAFDPTRMGILLCVASTVTSVGYDGLGDFLLDPLGRLVRRRPHEIAPFVYVGVALMTPAAFVGAPDGPFSLNLLFDRAAAAGRLHGLRHDGISLHVGTPEAIALAEHAILDSAA